VAQEAVTSIDAIAKGIERVRTAGRNAVLLRIEDASGGMRFVAVPIQ
jgi:serine protease Do